MTQGLKPRNDDVEDVFEDILGFNFRSFRTLRDVILRPAAVFQSYAARDRETYTPSLRLWLGLVGLQILFSVVWGGYGGLILEQWQSNPDQMALMEQAMGGPAEVIAGHYGDAAALTHAALVGGLTAFSAFLIGAFNKSLHWTSRINITFAILTAASLMGMLLLVAAAITDQLALMTWSVPAVALVYWVTFTRGAPGILATTRTGAFLKGGLFAIVAILLVFLGGLIMAFAGFGYAYYRINAG